MKTSKVGIVAVAILLVVTGIGFGIAQAGGTHTDRPVLSFENQVALDSQHSGVLEMSNESFPYREDRPVLAFDDLERPIETGSLPKEELRGNEDFIP